MAQPPDNAYGNRQFADWANLGDAHTFGSEFFESYKGNSDFAQSAFPDCMQDGTAKPVAVYNAYFDKYSDGCVTKSPQQFVQEDSNAALQHSAFAKLEKGEIPGNSVYSLTPGERIDAYQVGWPQRASYQASGPYSWIGQAKSPYSGSPPPLSAHPQSNRPFVQNSQPLYQYANAKSPASSQEYNRTNIDLQNRYPLEEKAKPQVKQDFYQSMAVAADNLPQYQPTQVQSSVLAGVLRIPLRFTQKVANAAYLDGTPLIQKRFAAYFQAQRIRMRNMVCECADETLQKQVDFCMGQQLSYYEYMAPAIAAEYFARGVEMQQDTLQIEADYLVFAAEGLENSCYNYVFVSIDQNKIDRERIVNAVANVNFLLCKAGNYKSIGGTICSCDEFLLIKLEIGIDDSCLGFELDKKAFFQSMAGLSACVGTQPQTYEAFSRIKPLKHGFSVSLEITMCYQYVKAQIEAVKSVSDRASTVPNFALLLGLHDNALYQYLAITYKRISRQSIDDAIAATNKMMEGLQMRGKIAYGSTDEQINVSTSVLSSGVALLQCKSDGNPVLTACLTLWSLAYVYREQGAVLCCTRTAKDAEFLALNASVFEMAGCAVYFCSEHNVNAGPRASLLSISLQRIIMQKILDGTYVGSQLSADENAHVVELIITQQFDAWTADQKFKELEQLEIESCAVLITTCENVVDERLKHKHFAASLVFEADTLLESECMLPISRAPNHVVLTARERCQSPELTNLYLYGANFGKSLFQRLVEMGLPVIKVAGAAATRPSPQAPLSASTRYPICPAPVYYKTLPAKQVAKLNGVGSQKYEKAIANSSQPVHLNAAAQNGAVPYLCKEMKPQRQSAPVSVPQYAVRASAPAQRQAPYPIQHAVYTQQLPTTVTKFGYQIAPVAVQPLPVEPSFSVEQLPAAPGFLGEQLPYPVNDAAKQTFAQEDSRLFTPEFPSVFWHVTRAYKSSGQQANSYNFDEAHIVLGLITYLVAAEGFTLAQITVVTPHEYQVKLISYLTYECGVVSIISPEQLQNYKNVVILASCVSSNEPHPGALSRYPYFCDLVRSNSTLASIFIGDAVYWAQENAQWAAMLYLYSEHNVLYEGEKLETLQHFTLQPAPAPAPAVVATMPYSSGFQPSVPPMQSQSQSGYLVPADSFRYPFPAIPVYSYPLLQDQLINCDAEKYNCCVSGQPAAKSVECQARDWANTASAYLAGYRPSAQTYATYSAAVDIYYLTQDNVCCCCKRAEPDWKLSCGHMYHLKCAIENYKYCQACVVCKVDYLDSVYAVLFAQEDEEQEKQRVGKPDICLICQQHLTDEATRVFSCGHEAHQQCCRHLASYYLLCPLCATYKQQDAAAVMHKIDAMYKSEQRRDAGKKPQKRK